MLEYAQSKKVDLGTPAAARSRPTTKTALFWHEEIIIHSLSSYRVAVAAPSFLSNLSRY